MMYDNNNYLIDILQQSDFEYAFVCLYVLSLTDRLRQWHGAFVFKIHMYLDTQIKKNKTRICAAEMAVRYAALSACRKVHVCHCNSLGGATWRSVTITGRTDRRTDRVRRNMRPPPKEEGRIINCVAWVLCFFYRSSTPAEIMPR